MASLSPKDRVSLCLFTYEDGRRCRTPRISSHPHFCFYHAQKESQSQTAEKLAKDLTYFFSGDYLSANDLNTALGRLIPAVVRGEIKPRLARTVAYKFQTLMQSTRLAQHEYINAFGTDGWRDAVYTSVTSNHDHLYPPDPNAPDPDANSDDAEPEDEIEDEFEDDPETDTDDMHPAPSTPPAQHAPSTPVGAGLARPASPTQPDRPAQPPPQSQPSAAATSAPPAATPPTPSSTRPTTAETEAALQVARSIFPDRANATQSQPATPTTNPAPTQTDQPNAAPPTTPLPAQPRRRPGEPIREDYTVHFDHTHRLMVDGKPW